MHHYYFFRRGFESMRVKHKVLHDKTKVRILVKGFKRIKQNQELPSPLPPPPLPPSGNFYTEVLIFRSSRSQMFFKIDMFLKTSQYWSQFLIKMQAFFNRSPMVAASRFSRQQILFF